MSPKISIALLLRRSTTIPFISLLLLSLLSRVTTSSAQTTAAAKDQNPKCRLWAKFGECDKNPEYMLKNCAVSCGVAKQPQQDSRIEYNTIDSVSKLPYDENGRLASHTLVTPDGPCAQLLSSNEGVVQNFNGFELKAVVGRAAMAYFGDSNGTSSSSLEECPVVCLERGVDKSLVTAVLPHKRYNPGDGRPFREWFRDDCRAAEFCVVNFYGDDTEDSVLNMYWWNPWKEEWKFRDKLRYGSEHLICSDTMIGHVFAFELDDNGTKGNIVLETMIEYTCTIPIGKAPPFVTGDTNFTRKIEETLGYEWDKHNMVQRTFSPLGFHKGRLPPEIFANMGSFYYNNRNNIYLEDIWGEGKGNGVFVNWWERDVYFLQIPLHYKIVWQEALKKQVEQWIGLPLEQTAMYGLRRYETGARLLTHVDRLETHAASLIVNIAQGNVAEPWPVEIHDHSGRLHQVLMEPGDVVYYESASCLHGRNTPLRGAGAYYVNLFTHYRPVGDPDWWKRENSDHTPPPVGDDIGECRVVEEDERNTEVRCDNPSIGRYLSPSMFTATSATDLLHWWRSVGPSPPAETKEEDGGVVDDEL